jgi:uncharacterized protein Yka (UPF0111/DUF47 family)
MSARGQLRRNGGDKPQSQQKGEEKKYLRKKTNDNNVGAHTKKKELKGMIDELDVFDYTVGHVDAVKFNEARRKLKTYLGTLYGKNNYFIDNPDKEYEFKTPNKLRFEATLLGIKRSTKNGLWKKYLQNFISKRETYEENKPKIYATIMGQCTTALLHKIKEDPDFETYDKEEDPRKLWKRILAVSLSQTGVTNEAKQKQEARDRFNRIYQLKTETVGDFYERFNIELTALSTVDRQQQSQSDLAMIFLHKLDRSRFQPMLDELENSFHAGKDMYPTTVSQVYTMALNRREHRSYVQQNTSNDLERKGTAFIVGGKFNKFKGKGKKRNFESTYNDNNDNNRKNRNVEFKSNEENDEETDNNDKSLIKCYFCEMFGHIKPDCELFKKAKKELLGTRKNKNKLLRANANVTFEDQVKDIKTAFVTEGRMEGMCFVCNRLGDFDILNDNEASVSVFHQAKLLRNIKESKNEMHVKGIGGTLVTNQIGEFWFSGKKINVYYHPDSVANILCFYDLTKVYEVSFNSHENYFMVKGQTNEVLEFKPKGKMYICDASHLANQNNTDKNFALINTVEENEMRFSPREVEGAKQARELQRRLGHPSVKDLIKMLSSGSILNCPVTVHDVKRAIEIYGPDLASLKGKTTRHKPESVKIETIDRIIPPEIIICLDVFTISGLPFLLSISKRLNLLMVRYLKDHSVPTMRSAIDDFISNYKSRNFKVTTVLFDGERGLVGVTNHLQSQGIIVNLSSKGEHVPEIERAGRQLKERVRAFWNTIPYKLTSMLLIYLVYYCVTTINMFPKASSIGNFSARELFLGRKVNFNTDCRIAFGEYAQVHEDNDITNTMKERTIGAIALGPTGNVQGAYDFMSLSTWKIIRRRSWNVLPIPREIIDLINLKAQMDSKALNLKDASFKLGLQNQAIDITNDIYEDVEETNQMGQQPTEFVDNNDNILENNLPLDNNETIVNDNTNNVEPIVKQTNDQEAEMPVIDGQIAGVEEQPVVDNNPTQLPDQNTAEDTTEMQVIDQNLRRSKRSNITTWRDMQELKENFSLVLTQMSMQAGIKKYKSTAIKSIKKEMSQMIEKKVFHPVHKKSLSSLQRKKIIRCHLFMKKKRDGTLKARFVVNGKQQDRYSVSMNISSPTVSMDSLFIIAALNASENRVVTTLDIEGAYLHADMTSEVYLYIEPTLASILVSIDQSYSQYLDDGSLIVKLDKALYGCIESAKLFYDHVHTTLTAMGFKRNGYDQCVFNKTINGKQCTIVVYVDDLMVSCVDVNIVEEVLAQLTKAYKKINIQRGKILDYLGMEFDYSVDGVVKISMKNMIEELLDELEVDGIASSPAANYLFKVTEDLPPLSSYDRELFHSTIAKLLYMSKRARPDILTAISFLTTRTINPTEEDLKKLFRVLKYLQGTKDLSLHLSMNKDILIHGYIDSSFGVHVDGKGHTGLVINIGDGAVFSKSSKQKLVARSSTEAELIGLADSLPQLIWTRNFFLEQGFSTGPVNILHDNLSTIKLVMNGKSTSTRTRHIEMRYFFIRDRIERKEAEINYKDSENMLADFYTKPLQGSKYRMLRDKIMNIPCENWSGIKKEEGNYDRKIKEKKVKD